MCSELWVQREASILGIKGNICNEMNQGDSTATEKIVVVIVRKEANIGLRM